MTYREEWYDESDDLPHLTIQDYLDVVANLIDGDQALIEIIDPVVKEKFDQVLGVLELTDEQYVVLCSALYNCLYSVNDTDIIEPPTARTILGDVFQRPDYRSKLRHIWHMTLNGILVRAEPSTPVVIEEGAEHDPLNDHYFVADWFVKFVADYAEMGFVKLKLLPVKERTIYDAQIGYEPALCKPVRITEPEDFFTKQEWEQIQAKLYEYSLEEVRNMHIEALSLYDTFLATNEIPESLEAHPIYGSIYVDGKARLFRLYLIANTIDYVDDIRTEDEEPERYEDDHEDEFDPRNN